MKKTLAALALAGSIALVGAAPSMATTITYPALPPQAAVSDGTVGPGETFVFRGQGFLAGESLTIRVTPGQAPASNGANIAGGRSVAARISVVSEAQTLKATADAQGVVSLPITINEPGTYSITATGDTSGVTVGPVTVQVTPAVLNANPNAAANANGNSPLANTGSSLANTGADSGLVLWTLVGAGALAAGATSVVVVRRRAKAEAAA
ncbi:LPXTG cell wall anchor domain-containing protein [Pseudarthrobacter sp. NamE2]|uniref:LPXTG cell wall anchor domain-containing protein n=1 Tax=Pseudarthrobacter sp. NamE2 TaxID=2576838 RepID=UPI0010FF4FB5|nr:LPXTG cell wall anchor domain-containing protein [Pseudarthrobacter sp. NamE2]TLM84537.1 LPXTG cell wall anchor domain-containing protein [Pseudarthrobacter sp. NamE2]